MPSHTIKLGEIEGIFETNIIPNETDNNIFSCSFFFMKEAEDKYTNRLKELILNFKNTTLKNSNHKIRLYYDITTKLFVEKEFSNIPYVQLYYYHFPQFFSIKNNRHYGFIGTLIRYLPLFSILNHQANKCWIIDIDNKFGTHMVNVVKYIESNHDIQFYHKTRFDYFIDRVMLIKNRPYFSIISSFIYQKNPISSSILINFLNNNLLKKTNNIYNQYLQNLIEIIKKKKKFNMISKSEARVLPEMMPFHYGVDELFLSRDFYDHYKNNNIPIYTSVFNITTYKGFKYHAQFLLLNDIKLSDSILKFIKLVSNIIKPNANIKSINDYHTLIMDNNSRKRFFEKDLCKNKSFINYFFTLKPESIHMPNIIFNKTKLAIKYCFTNKILILKYINNKYEEITKIPFK
jgi:hypothetical protein